MSPTDLLANVERPCGDRPERCIESEPAAIDGYWLGSSTAELNRWRARALAAEAELARLRETGGQRT